MLDSLLTVDQHTDQKRPSCRGMAAVITGGASGIGQATAQAMLEAGAKVAVIDLRSEGVPVQALAEVADVIDATAIHQAMRNIHEQLGRIDMLVNCAGIGAVGSIEDNDDAEWQRVLDVNVLGVARSIRAALPYLRRSPSPAIVNVSSIAATAGLPRRVCYSASKGAVLALTLAMAADLVREGVRVNCVTPGTIATPWVDRLIEAVTDPVGERAALAARQPIGRLGTAEEVARVITFLASPDAAFVTGAAWPVDGGMAGLRLPRGNVAADAVDHPQVRTEVSS